MDNELQKGYQPSEDFYENWAKYQEAILQVLVPIGWGQWLPR